MKRNRARTQERIVQAAVDMITQSGFSELGVNSVAARSGVDKVLIYRYFKGLDGLLTHIAENTEFYPPPAILFPEGHSQGLEEFIASYRSALKERPFTRMLLLWRTNTDNPLTRAITEQRQHFWREVQDIARPAGESDRAFLGCLRPVLEDSVSDGDITTAVANFSYMPFVPAEARASALADRQDIDASSEELPTNLL